MIGTDIIFPGTPEKSPKAFSSGEMREHMRALVDLLIDSDTPDCSKLGRKPEFLGFMNNSYGLIQRLLCDQILDAFSLWSSKYYQQGEGVAALSDTEEQLRQELPGLEARSSLLYKQHMRPLPSLCPSNISEYESKTAILAVWENSYPHDELLSFLANSNLKTAKVEIDSVSLETARQEFESSLRQVDNVAGFITLPPPSPQGWHEKHVEYSRWVDTNLKRILLFLQAVAPLIEERNGSLPLPFCGAITLNGCSGDEQDPFMASIDALMNGLNANFKYYPIVKAIDIDPEAPPPGSELFAEMMVRDLCGTVAIQNGQRHRLSWVREWPEEKKRTDIALDQESVIIAVGGATGICSACLMSLAERFGGRFILVGRSSIELDPFWEEVDGLESASEPELLRKAAVDLAKREGRPIEFGEFEAGVWHLLRVREIKHNIDRMEALGAEVRYTQADVVEDEQVKDLFQTVVKEHHKIDLVIHAAGVDESKDLLKKEIDSFGRVVAPKISGTLNILSAAKEAPGVQKVVLFSSAYAWVGLQGSIDYIAGNRFAAIAGESFKRQNPPLPVVSIFWGPWEEIGMASSGRLRGYFAENGINMLPRGEGKKAFLDIILRQDASRSVLDLVADMPPQAVDSYDKEAIFEANLSLRENQRRFPFLENIIQITKEQKVTILKEFCLSKDRYLLDHVFDNVPIVPGVIGMELMAEAANLIFPEFLVASVRNVTFSQPIKLFGNASVRVLVEATVTEKNDTQAVVVVKIMEMIRRKSGGFFLKGEPSYEASIYLSDTSPTLNNPDLRDHSGLGVFIPQEEVLSRCEQEGYHFGEIMTGISEGIFLSQSFCRSSISPSKERFLSAISEPQLSVNSFVIDAVMQNELRRSLFQQGFRLLPMRIKRLDLLKADTDTCGYQVYGKVIDWKNQDINTVRIEILDESGKKVVDGEAEAYITGKTKERRSQFGQGGVDFSFAEDTLIRLQLPLPKGGKLVNTSSRVPDTWLHPTGLKANARLSDGSVMARKALWHLIKKVDIESCQSLSVEKTKSGRPYLSASNRAIENVDISLAHKNGVGLAALSQSGRVGVDLEELDQTIDGAFFRGVANEAESQAVQRFSAASRYSIDSAKIILFACKEAVLKCISPDVSKPPLKSIVIKEMTANGDTLLAEEFHKSLLCQFLVFDGWIVACAWAESAIGK